MRCCNAGGINSIEILYYPVFELLTEQEKMRVLKHRAIFNLMYAIQQFENNTRIFYSLIRLEFQKLDNNTNLTKTLPKTRKVL